MENFSYAENKKNIGYSIKYTDFHIVGGQVSCQDGSDIANVYSKNGDGPVAGPALAKTFAPKDFDNTATPYKLLINGRNAWNKYWARYQEGGVFDPTHENFQKGEENKYLTWALKQKNLVGQTAYIIKKRKVRKPVCYCEIIGQNAKER